MAGTTLGNAYVQIIPSAQGISGSISNVLNGEATTAGTSAGSKIASFCKKTITAAAIGKALASTITEGAALEQSLGGIETLFKDSADKVKAYAKDAWQTAGISANTYMEQATSFSASLISSLGGDTAKAAEVANTAITDMADNANKMGTSIEDIQNAYQGFAKQNYTMLDNLKLGYGGTKTEMERLLADAEKISGVHYDISNLSDVYSAIHVIQQELGITGTTAEEAAATLTGSFNAMKAAFQDFLGQLAIGGDTQAALSNLISSLCTFLFDNLIPALVNIIEQLIPMLGTVIVEMVPQLLAYVLEAIPQLLEAVIVGLQSLADGMLEYINLMISDPAIAESATTAVSNFITGIFSKLPDLLAAITQILGSVLVAVVLGIGTLFKAAIQSIGDWLSQMWSGIKSKVSDIFGKLKETVTSKIDAIKDKIKSAIDKIKDFFNITLKFKGIKLPHIEIGWKTSGTIAKIAEKMGLPGVPEFSVNWYRTGGIFDEPSVIGLGEAGSEAVVPLDPLWERFDATEANITEGISEVIADALTNANIIVYSILDGKAVGKSVDKQLGKNATYSLRGTI